MEKLKKSSPAGKQKFVSFFADKYGQNDAITKTSENKAITDLDEESKIAKSNLDGLKASVKQSNSKTNFFTLLGGGKTVRTAATREFEIVSKNEKTIIVRFKVPNTQSYKCPISGCFKQSAVGIGAEANRYMVKHVKDHNLKIEFTFQCEICEALCPERYRYPTRWITDHLKTNHGIEEGKATALSTRETIEKSFREAAPSLALTKKPKQTPEKVELLRPQTRSVTKQLSALKDSKTAAKPANPRLSVSKLTLNPLKPIQEESSSISTRNPRRSLAPIFSTKPLIRSSLTPSLPTNQGIRPVSRPSIDKSTRPLVSSLLDPTKQTKQEKEVKLQPKSVGPLPTRKTSLPPLSNLNKKEEKGETEKRRSLHTIQKGEKGKNETNSKKGEIERNENKHLKVDPEIITLEEDNEKPKNKLNIWSLTHEQGNDAWLDSDIVTRYIEDVAKDYPRFSVVDPLLWHYCKDSVAEGARFITGMMADQNTHIFPICENSHWVLIVSTPTGWYYLDPFGPTKQMPKRIEEFSKFLKGTRLNYKTSPPKQTDSFNCGVHVCLMAKTIITDAPSWYSAPDIYLFRLNMLLALKQSEKYELYETKIHNQILDTTLPEPDYAELDITQNETIIEPKHEIPTIEEELLNETASEEDLNQSSAEPPKPQPKIPGLMDHILEKPAWLEPAPSKRQAKKSPVPTSQNRKIA
ncbi:unnamed protein product [Caenorhabditis angaria]|uniref:Ubiquitin-like protease family profile domain-containing protein n=1 Tax=Caenorhabditis angaria TaxID=860376 RepID=A0A9P1N0A8_9PELO|nr:unnamed protein product [Caenorhabditis angaria]